MAFDYKSRLLVVASCLQAMEFFHEASHNKLTQLTKDLILMCILFFLEFAETYKVEFLQLIS